MKNNSIVYRNKWPLVLFLLPVFVFLGLFLYYPFVMNIVNSFLSIDGLGAGASGVNDPWYANYVNMLSDPRFITSLKNTTIMMLCTVVFQVGIALVLALLVDSIKTGARIFRAVYFFPIVISASALGLLFNMIFMRNGGLVNQLLSEIGLIDEYINFKDETHYMFTMLAPVMWQYVGFYFAILVTGLNGISGDIYEAAAMDGARPMQIVFKIKLPLLYNSISTCLILAIIGSIKVFDLPWIMMGSGTPFNQSWLLGTYMYNQTFADGDVDYGSTIAVVIVVIGIVISSVANAALKEKDY